MSMPPEASGPVFTVMRPRRIGPLCERTTAGKPSAEAPIPAPAAWMNRLRLNFMVLLLWMIGTSVNGILRGVRLLQGLRAVESVDFHAFPENAHHRGRSGGIDVEELRAEHLRCETDIREGRCVAMAEAAGLLFLREVRFQRLERFSRPVREPPVARRLVPVHFLLEISADPRDDQRMPVAHDDLGEAPH